MEKNLKVWFTTPEQKIRPRSHLTWGKVEDYHVYVAKNATEGCQISFKAPEDRKGFSIEVRGRAAEAGFAVELLKEHYVSCDGALYPDPVDCSLPCSSVHGTFQARVLEWVAITFSSMIIHFHANI